MAGKITYDESSISILEGLEAVRKRPGMYIGSVSRKGLNHLIYEIVDNSVDEHLAGECDTIYVTLEKDGSCTVEDNGRGIPVGMHAKGVSAARIVFSTLHAGGKFDDSVYKTSGGLHGVGSSVVNALSVYMDVQISREGYVHHDRYERGTPVVALENGLLPKIAKTKKTGTKINFLPDPEIFEKTDFKEDEVKSRMHETAYLNPNLTIIYEDRRKEEVEHIVYHEPNGLIGFVKDINKNLDVLHEVIYFKGESENITVEAAIQYTNEFHENILGFCNNIYNAEGGTHITGFKTVFTTVINSYARELGILKEKDENFDGKDIRNGLVSIISIKHPDPQFEGQTKTKLGNTDAKSAVEDVFSSEVQRYFDKNVEELKKILDNSMKSYHARKAGDKARTAVLKQLHDVDTKSKLAACSSKKPEECEVYIVEGDSAGGTVKTARNRKTQAVLPLRGKILNVEKASLEKILLNNEIKAMIASFGCGIGDEFDITKLRYDKIIILTDADVDGAHISTLLLTFFYRFMPELINAGKIYRGLPPLYKVEYEKIENNNSYAQNNDSENSTHKIFHELTETYNNSSKKTTKSKKKKLSRYIFNDAELEKFKKLSNFKILNIQRYKGLGEMDAEQLWDTTLNPETRILAQVSISDTVEADEITTTLMSSNVPPRRAFIMEEAKYARLDI